MAAPGLTSPNGIRNPEALSERANNLGSLNGIRLVLVDLLPAINPTEARLQVQFFNSNHLAGLLAAVAAGPDQVASLFPIYGGHRLVAGPQTGQVQVTAAAAAADPNTLDLTVRPIGDYSTYTLGVAFAGMDPLLSEIDFKFRPACFNNCPPDWIPAPAPRPAPPIDYLAKDYDSFRHNLIAWMINRVPGWQPTSEADLDMVLLELFSAAGDELSDFQDRVINEGYIGSARKRVSLARHARLVDYHIHQGNQARTWLALRAKTAGALPAGFQVFTQADGAKPRQPAAAAQVFVSRSAQVIDPLLNELRLYTWSGAITALPAGSTVADLVLVSDPSQAAADTVRDRIRSGQVTRLLVQERLNPVTGRENGLDPSHRQLVSLLPGPAGAETLQDPLTGDFFVRVRWRLEDQLQSNYCFLVDCPGGPVDGVSLFHGNLVQVYHGRPVETVFRDPADPLMSVSERHYERNAYGEVLCRLPAGPLAYQDTPPGGEVPPRSTLEVEVTANGLTDPWDEVIDLVHSDDSDERGDHYVVETDELGSSLLRTGNGVNGRRLPDGAVVRARYQVGSGLDGNVGSGSLLYFDPLANPRVAACWNPFDGANGRAPEPPAQILRRAPEAYRYRQLRAITLQDYVDRAEEVAGVSRASARYRWTGSWRTVRITIDPVGATTLSDELRDQVSAHLEAVRLIGEDLELRAPQFVPLEIVATLCVAPEYWPQDVRAVLEQEFSTGYTPAGRPGFFHPDQWSFGQPLRASQILGRIQGVPGVDHVVGLEMHRRDRPLGVSSTILEVAPEEILLVQNDPDHLELGSIRFELEGGRQ